MDVGDKFHYLLSCSAFHTQRTKLIPRKFTSYPNMIKYRQLLENTNLKVLKNLSKFIKHVFDSF